MILILSNVKGNNDTKTSILMTKAMGENSATNHVDTKRPGRSSLTLRTNTCVVGNGRIIPGEAYLFINSELLVTHYK